MASNMYKRLGSNKLFPLNPSSDCEELEWNEAKKEKPSHRSKTTSIVLVVIIMCVYFLSRNVGDRFHKSYVRNDLNDRAPELVPEEAIPFANQNMQGAASNKPSVVNIESLDTPSVTEMQETGPESAPDQPSELLVELDHRVEAEVMNSDDTTEAPISANPHGQTRLNQVLEEWGISRDQKFYNIDQFKAIIGVQCPPLRHCSKKTAVNLFQRGGKWTKQESGELMWNSHNCWMYQFSGREKWVREENSEQQHLIIFIDGDNEPGIFREAASLSELFHYLQNPFPANHKQFLELEEKLARIVSEHSYARFVDVSIVLNWFVPGRAPQLARTLYQVGATLQRVRSTRVMWTTRAYSRIQNAQFIIKFNEAMATEIAANIKNKASSWKIRRSPGQKQFSNNFLGGSGRGVDRMLSTADFVSQAPKSVLFDVRSTLKPSGPHQEYFSQNAYSLPLSDILLGWIPNFHQETKIIVFCGNGVSALRASRILRQQGFKNVSPVALDVIASGSLPAGLPSSIRVNSEVSIAGIDTFAPSLAAPGEIAVPANSSLIAKYTANAVLNDVFRREITERSHRPSVEHICQSSSSCSSCFMSVGDIPSSRLNFATIAYMSRRDVPHKITLSKEHLIWDGDWVSFFEQNRQSLLTIRKNYASTKTRKFEKQPLSSYLQSANIVRQSAEGKLHETGEAPEPGSLPDYAGNNKLSVSRMAEFNFKYPEWIQRKSFEKPSMWLGPKGSLSSLHIDHTNKGNFAYQVLGTKKWILYPPRSSDFMYGKKVGVVVWSGIIDPTEYDENMSQSKPIFQMSIPESIEINVHQGEMLYNPDKWWHIVYNTESSLMLNFWIRNSVGMRPIPNN